MTATRKKIFYAAPMACTDLNIRTKKVRRGSNFFFNLSSQNKVFVIGILKKIFEKKHSNKHSVVFRPFLDILSLNVKKELKKLTQHVLTSAPHFFPIKI